MFSEKDLVARSIEDMAQEVEELQALAREEREKERSSQSEGDRAAPEVRGDEISECRTGGELLAGGREHPR